jgi:hypothetical protein
MPRHRQALYVACNAMQPSYTNILKKIDPYKDKAFWFPMGESEIKDLEKRIGQNFPSYFKQFLLTFGIRQDFVFDLFRREQDYIDEYSFLPKRFRKHFVPIGKSAAGGDTWLIKVHSEEQKIYEYWHEDYGELSTLEYSFMQLIDRDIAELAELYNNKPLNKDKSWCVQFSIPTKMETLLLNTIEAEQTKNWTEAEISSAGVFSYETEIKLTSKKIKLSRQEYKGWKEPNYYFNWKEPAYQIGANSYIRTLDKKLTKVFKGYKLIDYGILALTAD